MTEAGRRNTNIRVRVQSEAVLGNPFKSAPPMAHYSVFEAGMELNKLDRCSRWVTIGLLRLRCDQSLNQQIYY